MQIIKLMLKFCAISIFTTHDIETVLDYYVTWKRIIWVNRTLHFGPKFIVFRSSFFVICSSGITRITSNVSLWRVHSGHKLLLCLCWDVKVVELLAKESSTLVLILLSMLKTDVVDLSTVSLSVRDSVDKVMPRYIQYSLLSQTTRT